MAVFNYKIRKEKVLQNQLRFSFALFPWKKLALSLTPGKMTRGNLF